MTYEEALKEWAWRRMKDWKRKDRAESKDDIVEVVVEMGSTGYCESCYYEYQALFAVLKNGKRVEITSIDIVPFGSLIEEIATIAAEG